MMNLITLFIVGVGITIGTLVPSFSPETNSISDNITGELNSFQKSTAALLGKLEFISKLTNNTNTTTEIETEAATPEIKTPTDRTLLNAANITYWVNKERTNRGLKALKTNSKLTQSARAKAADMITYNYFAHESPIDSKKDFSYFIDKQSYVFIRVSENLAMGEFTTADEVVDAWMKSPAHAANILLPDYRDTGVSIQIKPNKKGGSDIIIVQHFGIAKNTCPSISDEITSSLKSIESQAKSAKDKAEELKARIDKEQTKLSENDLDELIGMYNTTIRSYNSLVGKFTMITEQYNKAAETYNNCILK